MIGSQKDFRHGDWCSHCKHYNEITFKKSDCDCICHTRNDTGYPKNRG